MPSVMSYMKDKCCMIHLYVEVKNTELTETESRMMFARYRELGEMGRCWSKGTNFQL